MSWSQKKDGISRLDTAYDSFDMEKKSVRKPSANRIAANISETGLRYSSR